MIKRIIFTVILLAIVIGVGNIIGDSYRLIAHDRIAVSQLEDSDENYVGMNASTRMMKFMPWIQFFIIVGVLWFIWAGYVKRKIKKFKAGD